MDAFAVELIPAEEVHANPWQTRLDEDPAHVADIAESIKIVGLLQAPIGRWSTEDTGGNDCELAFGHTRFSAWKIAKPGEPFPVIIRELSDRQMSDLAAEENSRRKNLTAIETAKAIQKRIEDFGLTQLEAGKPFGYASQGAVSNLLRLLKLPDSVQAHVASGELPERLAREIIPLAKVLPQEAVQIADQVARSDDGERDNTMDNVYNDLLRRRAKWFHNVPWEMGWPAKPIQVEGHKSIAQIPACKSCEFFVNRQHGSNACLRPECFQLKQDYAARAKVKAASDRLKIAVRVGEKTEVVFDGDARQESVAAKALITKHESLRLAPLAKDDYNGYARKRVLGSEWVALHTTDMAGLRKAIAALPKEKKQTAQDKYQNDYERQRKKDQARRAEVVRLFRAAAPHVAKAFAWPEAVLDMLILAMSARHWSDTSTKVEERAKASDAAGKARIIAEIVISTRVHGAFFHSNVQPGEAQKKIQTLADVLKVKLPPGWAEPAPAKVSTHGNGHKAGVGVSTGKLSRAAKAKQRA